MPIAPPVDGHVGSSQCAIDIRLRRSTCQVLFLRSVLTYFSSFLKVGTTYETIQNKLVAFTNRRRVLVDCLLFLRHDQHDRRKLHPTSICRRITRVRKLRTRSEQNFTKAKSQGKNACGKSSIGQLTVKTAAIISPSTSRIYLCQIVKPDSAAENFSYQRPSACVHETPRDSTVVSGSSDRQARDNDNTFAATLCPMRLRLCNCSGNVRYDTLLNPGNPSAPRLRERYAGMQYLADDIIVSIGAMPQSPRPLGHGPAMHNEDAAFYNVHKSQSRN